jgi:hypothetical protein
LPDERARRRLTEIRQNLLLGEEDATKIEEELTQKLNIQSEPATLIPCNTAATRVDIPPRYAQLEQLLRDRKWREADRETYLLMITTVGKV